ncbi:MAG: disulfide oxidoreductase, partial [Paracoccaceae bacterium]|nr:disulfide oxidoreductase [Paracoccaceae bacterium]
GYKAEKGERPKVKPETVTAGEVPESPEETPVELPIEAPSEAPEAPSEAPVEAPSEVPGEAPTETPPEAAVETESFYTFTWAPRPRGGHAHRGAERGNNRPRGNRPAQAVAAEGEAAAAPAGDRPNRDRRNGGQDRANGKPKGEGYQGKPKGERFQGKPGGKSNDRGPRREDTKAKSFEARPPREQKIDPDNPFAVLMALKDRK